MLVNVPKLEADFGIDLYASKHKGIGGRIRTFTEDFIVEEVLTDGSKASIHPSDTPTITSGHGRYLVCVLIKKSRDTLALVESIGRQIGLSRGRISFAGMKDAHALTAQFVSLGGVPPEKVQNVSLENAMIIPMRFSSEKVSSKFLLGNQFIIVVRSLEHSHSAAKRMMDRTRKELADFGGIPNFFGHQRFGTVRPITHIVGRCILKGDFEAAVSVFLTESSLYEHPEAREARERLRQSNDFKSASKEFPRMLTYERVMIRHLSRYPKDFLGAFQKVPQSLRVLFLHAYQSYLFNRILSERMKLQISLRKAEIGDCVVTLDRSRLPTNIFKEAKSSNISEINREIGKGELAVALPILGFKQVPSKGRQGEIEREVMDQEGVSSTDFRLRRMPDASARGSLRRAIAPILSLGVSENEPTDQNGLSLRFHFTLHKGSYATVLLREFMKPKDPVKAGF